MNLFYNNIEDKIFGKSIIFNDLTFDNTNKLYELQFIHDNVFYTYYVDIDVKEDIVQQYEHCRYLGEIDCGYRRDFTFKVKLTRIVEILSTPENMGHVFGNNEIKIIEEFFNDYFEQYPDIYEDL